LDGRPDRIGRTCKIGGIQHKWRGWNDGVSVDAGQARRPVENDTAVEKRLPDLLRYPLFSRQRPAFGPFIPP